MAKFTLSNVRGWIDEYAQAHPEGTDVTAYVLSKIGREGAEAHAQGARIDLGQANQEIGRTVKEMLLRAYPNSQQLPPVPVNEARWPDLAGWVTSYTAYRIAK